MLWPVALAGFFCATAALAQPISPPNGWRVLDQGRGSGTFGIECTSPACGQGSSSLVTENTAIQSTYAGFARSAEARADAVRHFADFARVRGHEVLRANNALRRSEFVVEVLALMSHGGGKGHLYQRYVWTPDGRAFTYTGAGATARNAVNAVETLRRLRRP